MSFVADHEDFEQWRYNLLLVNPGKGEAKKTVGGGVIRISVVTSYYLMGLASDDILSVAAGLPLGDPEDTELEPSWWTAEDLKRVEGTPIEGRGNCRLYQLSDPTPEYSEEFDRIFWKEHVWESIFGDALGAYKWGLGLSPDRLRKFSLLKPTGLPIEWDFCEWADRDIIRWSYGEHTKGVYVPLDYIL